MPCARFALGWVVIAFLSASAAAAEPKLLVRPEAFPTLVNPACSHCVDEAQRRKAELRDDDRVLAWIRGKYDGGAIPLRFFLVPYRVISDTYGVFVYDADAGFLRGYEPSLEFTFHGWRNGVLVMKHKDGTLYSALTGKAFDGPRKGDQLKPVATIATDWGPWIKAYPGTVAYHMFDKYKAVDPPRSANADSVGTRPPLGESTIAAETEVTGLSLGDKSVAYTIEWLKTRGRVASDALGDQKLAILWSEATRTAAIYAPEIEGTTPPQKVTLQPDSKDPAAPFVDAETSSRWDIAGRAVAGPLKGKTLRWLPAVQCRWFAWKAEYPATLLHDGRHAGVGDARGAKPTERKPTTATTGVILAPAAATAERVGEAVRAGHGRIVVPLEDTTPAETYERIARDATAVGGELFYWIEIARNTVLADAHPEWLAALGVHDDWRRGFPDVPAARPGEVAKAYPWVPLGYKGAYAAHLERVGRLLRERARGAYAGVLLNDLQAGPAACGCGNLLCRWALDYNVAATAEKTSPGEAAARFVADVRRLAPGKQIIPVWTTECEEVDLPAKLRGGQPSSGLCGGVPCAHGLCPRKFAEQWSQLVAAGPEQIALLALDGEFGRRRAASGGAAWIEAVAASLDKSAARHGAKTWPRDALWLVVQAYDTPAADIAAAEAAARRTGAATILLAHARIDQSFRPRMVKASAPAAADHDRHE